MVDRISLLLKAKNITASLFADEIGVQRSSISHVLSGRNKPSLEFIQKILKRYPEINPDWLLFGKGPMNMEFNLFSETNEDIPLKEELISNALQKQETLIRPEKEEPDEQPVKKVYKDEKPVAAELSKPPEIHHRSEEGERPDPQPIKQDSIPLESPLQVSTEKKVDRVLLFFDNKTFREYKPE